MGFYRKTWPIVLAKCDCGKTIKTRINSIRDGKTRSCGCARVEEASKIRSPDAIERQLFFNYRQNARNKSRSFDLSYEQFCKLLQANCDYCASPPCTLRVLRRKHHTHTLLFNGVDRVDNTQGYTVTNSVTCCRYCNRAKGDATLDEFKAWVERLSKHMKKPRL